jgi:predicted metalloprotease
MRWDKSRQSNNVEDRRGQSPAYGAAAAPMVLRLLPALVRTRTGRILLIAGVLLVLGSNLLGVDILSALLGGGGATARQEQMSPQEEELAQFVSFVLADTEDTWHAVFENAGGRYREPTLVLFSGRVNSACGLASAAVGPFYCPGDQKVYIDLSFYRDLQDRHGAPGDFAQAYVIAHEVGHHVQNLLGTSDKVQRMRQRLPESQANALSVRLELQADCYAGLWGYHAHTRRQLLDPGDLEEALVAAAAIGDDRLQREATGHVVPDSFTHGTSEQRTRWFRRGFERGDIARCDTFETSQP